MANTFLIDAGNTRVKWCVYSGKDQSSVFRFDHHEAHPTHELSLAALRGAWGRRLREVALGHQVGAVWVSHVLSHEWFMALKEAFSPLQVRCAGVEPNVLLATRYRDPNQLGLDRWLAALAVSNRSRADLNLVVSLGTATTVDAVVRGSVLEKTLRAGEGAYVFSDTSQLCDSRWVHLGGLIIPGIGTMFNSLEDAAVQLQASEPAHVDWPTSTCEAMGAGVFLAQQQLIQSQLSALVQQFGRRSLTLWLHGGYARTSGFGFTQTDDIVFFDDAVFTGLAVQSGGCFEV